MTGLQGDRNLGGQNFPTGPIDYRRKIDKPLGHRDISRIQCPNLVGPLNGQAPQQIWVYFMAEMPLAGPRLSVQCFNSHTFHQCADTLAAHIETCSIKLIAQHAGTHEWVLKVQSVNPTHERQIRRADWLGLIVDAAPANAN